jgi:hypothetical protein
MLLLNATSYEEITGQNFGNTKTSAKFNAVAQLIQDTVVEPALPPLMWTVIQDETAGVELTAFVEDYVKRFMAYAMYDYITVNPVQTTNIGSRIMTTQTSSNASDGQLGVAVQQVAKATDLYRERMYNRYLLVSYVFDGTAYPPRPSMQKFWQNHWAGLAYGNGSNGWGWYGAGGWLPPFGGTRAVSANGIQIIPIKAGW